MSANLNLLPRKEFELTLSDGTIVKGQFGTWAFARFGQKRKAGLEAVLNIFSGDLAIMDMIDFIVCAVEYKERELGLPLSFNDIKLSKWVDDYSKESGKGNILIDLLSHSRDEEDEKKNISQPEAQESAVGVV